MRCRLFSDLHVYWHMPDSPRVFVHRFVERMMAEQARDPADIAIVLGDMVDVTREDEDASVTLEVWSDCMQMLARVCPRTIFVPGNHEYYSSFYELHASTVSGMPFQSIDAFMELICREYGIVYLNHGNVCVIDDVLFVGATLWTDMPLNRHGHSLYRSTMDFRKIVVSGPKNTLCKFVPEDWVTLHNLHLARLEQSIVQTHAKHRKVVALTHHAPLLALCAARQERSKWPVMHAYGCDDILPIITNGAVDHWFYGHTHNSGRVLLHGVDFATNAYGRLPSETDAFRYDFIVDI